MRSFTHARLLVTGTTQSNGSIIIPWDGWIVHMAISMSPRVTGLGLADGYAHAWISGNIVTEAELLTAGVTAAAQVYLYVAATIDRAVTDTGDNWDRQSQWNSVPIYVQRRQSIFCSGVGVTGGSLEIHWILHLVQQLGTRGIP